MIRHFFIDKSATLIKGSKANTGLNPILSLNYGDAISRGILHFDEAPIKSWMCENGLSFNGKLTFKLKMTNCFSVDGLPYNKELVSTPGNMSERASSFDLVLYKLEQDFDEGRGFDYESDVWNGPATSYSERGASWRYCTGDTKWNTTGSYTPGTEIATKHFDFGNENIDIDITSYVKSVIETGINHGLGLKFSKEQEDITAIQQQYVGFFTDHTNTFFHPVIEAIWDDSIMDNRASFYVGKENKIYLYSNTVDGPITFDEMPTCVIDDIEYPVSIAQNGVYYATIPASASSFSVGTIYYDVWSNLKVNGYDIADVEMEFVALPPVVYLQIGNKSSFKDMVVPSLSGINDNEDLNRGEIREVIVDFRKKYTTDKKDLIDSAEWKLYVKDANREIDVFDYQPVEMAFLNNFFVINTQDLIPNKYYIDIRVRHGREERYYKNVLNFNVKSNITERYY